MEEDSRGKWFRILEAASISDSLDNSAPSMPRKVLLNSLENLNISIPNHSHLL